MAKHFSPGWLSVISRFLDRIDLLLEGTLILPGLDLRGEWSRLHLLFGRRRIVDRGDWRVPTSRHSAKAGDQVKIIARLSYRALTNWRNKLPPSGATGRSQISSTLSKVGRRNYRCRSRNQPSRLALARAVDQFSRRAEINPVSGPGMLRRRWEIVGSVVP